MDRKASSIIFLAFFFVSSASAFDILKLLEKDSELSSFSKYLKETKLADQINSRSTITVLAVGNGGVSGLSGKPQDVVKMVLSAHVVLDYYDEQKLIKLAKTNKTSSLTTMLQASGLAQNQQGFINVGLINEGELAFGSAVKGANLDSKLVKSVTSQPYNISVLQVTSLLEIPSLGAASPGAAPKSSHSKAPSPSQSQSPSPSSDDDKEVPSPSPSDDDKAISSPPVSGDSPAEAPEKEKASSDAAPAPSPSAASRVEVALGAGLVIALASLLA